MSAFGTLHLFRCQTSKSVRKTFIKSIDFWGKVWYNILVRMRDNPNLREARLILNPWKNSGRDGGGTGTRGQTVDLKARLWRAGQSLEP